MGKCRWKTSGEIQSEWLASPQGKCAAQGKEWSKGRCIWVGNDNTDRRTAAEKKRQADAQASKTKCDHEGGYWNGKLCVFD